MMGGGGFWLGDKQATGHRQVVSDGPLVGNGQAVAMGLQWAIGSSLRPGQLGISAREGILILT